MISLGTISFFAPWAFAGLALLPLVWWLIKLTPIRTRHMKFPAVRLLQRVGKTETTAQVTPLWLIVLRSLIIAVLVFAAAQPVHNPESGPEAGFPSGGPLLLVIDDGWAAARDWDVRRQQAAGLIHQAQRQDRNVIILTTAPGVSGQRVEVLAPPQALEFVDSLQPKPWSTRRQQITDLVNGVSALPKTVGQVVWLHDGIAASPDNGHMNQALDALRSLGAVRVVEPSRASNVRMIYPPEGSGANLRLPVRRVSGIGSETVTLTGYDHEGRAVGNAVAGFEQGALEAESVFDLPLELRNRMESVRLDGETTAAGVLLLDERWRRRPVGLVHEVSLADNRPLLNDIYYLDRALEPLTEVSSGTLRDMVRRDMAVIILPDSGILAAQDTASLHQWVDDGGVLVVFAGPRFVSTAQAKSVPSQSSGSLTALLPVELRLGGRAMGGTMSWRKPVEIAPFHENSPFYGLSVADDVRVRQQVLAEPDPDIEKKIWARLVDGTPLVTAAAQNHGWTVLFHVSANAEWSSLPLSGLFVEMLQRIVGISQGRDEAHGTMALEPDRVLDGFGLLVPPGSGINAVVAGEIPTTPPSPVNPPGFYGSDQNIRAVNLTATLDVPHLLDTVPAGVERVAYRKNPWFDLLPLALVIAMALVVLDLLLTTGLVRGIMEMMQNSGSDKPGKAQTFSVVFALVLASGGGLWSGSAGAQDVDHDVAFIDAINNTRLAYVLNGNEQIDETSRLGLRGLTVVLAQRTAVELAEPVPVHIETDELVVFPLIYWPITGTTKIPVPATAERVNAFMANGGTILFDMQQSGDGAVFEQLRKLARVLDIPRLVPVPGDHVLTRSYYLINDFPGRWTGERVWVVPSRERVNDGVSPVIAGSHQWAHAWALDDLGQPLFAAVPGGERQRELAFRFGVNLTMYVLTGNYKDDQVHLDSILERLN